MNEKTKYMQLTVEYKTEENLKHKIHLALERFVNWLEYFGELSQDHYDFWATSWGQRAKSIYYQNPRIGATGVLPFIFLDSFIPASRKIFRGRQRFPIADAHFAMGFVYLYQTMGEAKFYNKAVHFLEILKHTRCPGYDNYGWGYPFDWMTISGKYKKFTPLITTTPYVYEAFSTVYEIDSDKKWLEIMHSVAEHVANDYCDEKIKSKVHVCSYFTRNQSSNLKFHHCINANAYRAFMLTDAAHRLDNEEYWKIAECNLNFVLESQQSDGSWFYAANEVGSFVDHFHTCFVLKNLVKIERLTGHIGCRNAIKRGMEYYFVNLIDEKGLPKPFAKKQRVTLFRRELYDYAESINLALLHMGDCGRFRNILNLQLSDLLSRWQKPDGSFRTRQLLFGWNNVPYHRWAQAQLFRSLSLWLKRENKNNTDNSI